MKLIYSVFQLQPQAAPYHLQQYAFWLILQGQGQLIAADMSLDFCSHDLLELPFRKDFRIESSMPIFVGCIELTDFPITNTKIKKIDHVHTALIRNTFYNALDLCGTHHPAKKQLQNASDQMMLNTLLNHPEIAGSAQPMVYQVIQEINQHFTEADFNINLCIDATGYSKNHFRKLFCEQTGFPPVQYLQMRRLEHAKSLLKERNSLTIREIAQHSGFSDAFYFSRQFAKATGVSPSEFRGRFV